jgi:DedD protein
MERALKERIVGAIVLVALAVLVVPVFLDGPPPAGEIRTERVPLPGQDDQKTQTVVLDRQRSEPVPAQATVADPDEDAQAAESSDNDGDGTPAAPVTTTDEAPPDIDVEPAAAEPPGTSSSAAPVAPVPEPAAPRGATVQAATSSTTGMFAVQLGSFSSKANAEKLAAELRRQGFAAFLSQLDADAGQLHRVRVGPQKDRQAAESMAARLAAAGHKGQVVTHP